MNKICCVCQIVYKIPDCRWESQIIKVPCCSVSCKHTGQYKEHANNYLIQNRGYPGGYHSKEEYDSRFLPEEIICAACDNKFTPKYKTQKCCSKKCSYSDESRNKKISRAWEEKVVVSSVVQKRRATCLEKYGYTNPNQVPEIQNKAKQTNLKKYGVENPFQDKEIVIKGVQKKYGVDNYFQRTDLLKQDYKNKLGAENPQQVPEIKQKTLRTVKEKYGETLGAVPAKQTKKTNLERYGHEQFFASEKGKMSFQNLKNNYGWTEDQIETLKRKRVHNNGIIGRASKESLKYFIPLYKKLRKYGKLPNDFHFGLGDNKEKYIDGYLYDFCIESLKLIIEYHGERFHPNPHKLNETAWKHWMQLFTGRSAAACFSLDQQKIIVAQKNGYTTIEIWSNNTKEENWTIIKDLFLQKGIQL